MTMRSSLVDETALSPLNAGLLDDVAKTVEELRRRLHIIQSSSDLSAQLHAKMSSRYAQQYALVERMRDAGTGSSDAPRSAVAPMPFYPVTTAPVDHLPVPLCSTLLPRYTAPLPPDAKSGDEKPAWNSSTQASSMLSERATNRSTDTTRRQPRRLVKVAVSSGTATPNSQPTERNRPSRSASRTSFAPRPSSFCRLEPTGVSRLRARASVVLTLPDEEVAAVREQELAVRDFLRRMNILAASPSPDSGDGALRDPLYNGTALVRLVHCLYAAEKDAVAIQRVRTIEDAVCNFTTVHRIVSAVQQVPSALLSNVSADVSIGDGDPRPVLALFVHLITNHLPPPEELPFADPALTCQPPADVGDELWPPTARRRTSGDALWEAEREVCAFLFTYGALPAPEVHMLPGDDCVVPDPLSAPFLARQGERLFAPRTAEPAALYVPSVFPFLCNGVALVALAQQCVPDGLLLDVPPSESTHLNPRTKRSCLANIHWALARLQRLFPAPSVLHDPSAAEMFFRGFRSGIVAVLSLTLRRLREREASSPRPVPARHRRPDTWTDGDDGGDDAATPVPSAAAPPTSARSGASRSVGASQSGPEATPTTAQKWLLDALGPDAAYTAEDGSFSYANLQSGTWSDPCYVFSDGVLLSRLISRLERRRCPALDCVRPTAKAAAKRFNLAQCLSFLETERGVRLNAGHITEGLLAGSVDVVVHVMHLLRHAYKQP